jgi:hypothetical protein
MARSEDANTGHNRLSVADLRRAKPLKLFGGRSAGTACDFCRVSITANDPEYEVDAELDGVKVALHFHVACYDAWRAGSASDDAPAAPDAHDTAA